MWVFPKLLGGNWITFGGLLSPLLKPSLTIVWRRTPINGLKQKEMELQRKQRTD